MTAAPPARISIPFLTDIQAHFISDSPGLLHDYSAFAAGAGGREKKTRSTVSEPIEKYGVQEPVRSTSALTQRGPIPAIGDKWGARLPISAPHYWLEEGGQKNGDMTPHASKLRQDIDPRRLAFSRKH